MIRGFDPGDEGSVIMLRLITSHQNDSLLCSKNIKWRFNTNVSTFSLYGNNVYCDEVSLHRNFPNSLNLHISELYFMTIGSNDYTACERVCSLMLTSYWTLQFPSALQSIKPLVAHCLVFLAAELQ